jgi:hypothetical protein
MRVELLVMSRPVTRARPAKLVGLPRPKAGPGARSPRRRTPRAPQLGSVDYTLAKRALLRDFRRGALSRFEICDAHPELLRAARYLGDDASSPCPVCDRYELRLLAYVYADGLKRNNGRAFQVQEALAVASAHRGGACYVVEVCTGCSWNHLAEAITVRTAGRAG